jgi:hypothetical protein
LSACKVLGLARLRTLTIHHGRHTYISHSLAGGKSLAEVKSAAGHASLLTTSVYLHVAVMLNQGKTVEEIERVLQASSTPSLAARMGDVPNRPPGAVIDEAFLISSMCEQGLEAGTIEKVLRLFKSGAATPELQQREGRIILELIEQGQDVQFIEVIIKAARDPVSTNGIPALSQT